LRQSELRPNDRAGLALKLTVFLIGAAVLIVEIAGARLLSPYFGSNLYVWSAVISVTLFALALGYWRGGQLADARGSHGLLDRLIAAAALLVALDPLFVQATARRLIELPFQAGILLAALVCFAPPLLVLGAVTPVAIRIAVPDFGHVGRAAGAVYACSAAGGILGALAAGFLLLPHWPVNRVFFVTAAVLAALAAARWLARRRSPLTSAAAAMALLAVGGMPVPPSRSWEARAERGFRVVAEKPGFYGWVRVVESDRLRYLLVDGSAQSMQTLGGYPFFRPVWALGVSANLRTRSKNALLIGLGGGDLVRLFRRHDLRITAVELDPVVVETAFHHFGLRRDDLRVVVDDGRRYLARHPADLDIIVLDAYAGSCPPLHLFSQEAFAEMKSKLRPGGLLAVNVVARGYRDRLAAGVAATLATLFPHLLAVPTEGDPARLGNLVFFASDQPLAFPAAWNPDPSARPMRLFWTPLATASSPRASSPVRSSSTGRIRSICCRPPPTSRPAPPTAPTSRRLSCTEASAGLSSGLSATGPRFHFQQSKMMIIGPHGQPEALA